MGTHPIFESDFDCLTDAVVWKNRFGTGWLEEKVEQKSMTIVL